MVGPQYALPGLLREPGTILHGADDVLLPALETAADVEYNRVLGIPGLDAITSNNLCAWRSDWERRFTVNKSQGVPPAQRQALLLKYAQIRQQLEFKLRAGSGRLREVETRLHAALEELAPKIDTAYVELAQAYTNVEIMSPRKLRGLG